MNSVERGKYPAMADPTRLIPIWEPAIYTEIYVTEHSYYDRKRRGYNVMRKQQAIGGTVRTCTLLHEIPQRWLARWIANALMAAYLAGRTDGAREATE